MKKISIIILLSVLSILNAKIISNINIKNSITINHQKLLLNGAGVRSMFFFNIYIGALYVQNRETNPQKIINSKQTMNIRMIITSSLISSQKMKNGFKDAFKKSLKSGYYTNKKTIQQFLTTFNTKISKKDIYDFLFYQKNGVMIYKNHKLIQTINSFAFKKALFAIWFGYYPAQESLKKKMLGNR